MLLNTNSVFRYAKSVFRGEISPEEISDSPLKIYDEVHQREGVAKVKLKISRVFVMHDFTDGYMWIKYTYILHDKDGNLLYGARLEFPLYAKWTIHKENGKWVVVDVDEPL